MAHLCQQGLQLLVLLIVISESRDVSPLTETVVASEKEDACFESHVDPKSCYRVRFIKYSTNTSQTAVILARPKTPKFQDAERVKWQADANGQMSLCVTESQKSDEGLYRCEIWQGWDCVLVRNISLRIKECKTLQAVKAAPSAPVHLTCPVDTTSGHQNVSWTTLKDGDSVSVNSTRADMNGTSLVIQSVSYNDSGWYRCRYVFGQIQRCFDMNLLVQEENDAMATKVPELTTSETIWEPGKEGSSGAFIAVVVSSVVFGIAILAAPTGLFIYRRRKAQRATQQRDTAGNRDVYETVNLTLSEDRTNQQSTVDGLDQQFSDESLRTFRY